MLPPLLDLLASADFQWIQNWMSQAFYPALLSILVLASLGIPIPEDIPLIAAGVILATQGESVATWPLTLLVAFCGIMSGDVILYTMGRRWGSDVVNHRWVRRLLTPERFQVMKHHFHRHGTWMCFIGRFFMGIRGAMCITAGATHFPFVRFFLADFAGALLSVPFFVWLGYWFAQNIPLLLTYVKDVQGIVLVVLVAAIVIGVVVYKVRKARRGAGLAEKLLHLGPEGAAVEKSAAKEVAAAPTATPAPPKAAKDKLAPARPS